MEIEVGKTSPQKGRSATRAVLPEVDVYLHLLVMINLLDQEALEKVLVLIAATRPSCGYRLESAARSWSPR